MNTKINQDNIQTLLINYNEIKNELNNINNNSMNPINKNVNKKEEQNQQLLAACQNIKNNNNNNKSIKTNFTKSQIITNNISINSNNDSSIGEEIESNNNVKKILKLRIIRK